MTSPNNKTTQNRRAVARPYDIVFVSSAILLLLFVCALYAVTLTFPFYSDDIPILSGMRDTTLVEVLTQPDVFGTYYRPLSKVLYWLRLPAWAYYALSLLTHLLNIVLVGRVARLLKLGQRGQLAAMVGMALLPFTAQAVMWVASYEHVLVTCLTLLLTVTSIHCLQVIGRSNVGRNTLLRPYPYLAFTWLIGAIVPFTHENGILAVPLAGWIMLGVVGFRAMLHRWRTVALIFSIPGMATVAFYLIRANALDGAPSLSLDHFQQNSLLWLQWTTLPTQYLARFVPVASTWQVIIGAGLFVAIAGAIVLWRGNRRAITVMLIGGVWSFVGYLPAAAVLHPAYTIWSERLLYLSAVGVAMVLAAVLSRVPRWAYAIALLGMVLGFGIINMRYRADMLAHNTVYQALLHEVDTHVSTDEAVLFINLPSYTEHQQAILPLSSVRAFMLSDWISFHDFLLVNTGKSYPHVDVINNSSLADEWAGREQAYFGRFVPTDRLAATIAQHDSIYRVRFRDEAYLLAQVGQRKDSIQSEAWQFGDSIQLGEIAAIKQDDTAIISLQWQRTSNVSIPYIAFVHLLCDGTIISQRDAAPLANLYPFDLWRTNEAWTEFRYLPTESAICSQWQVRVGLYDPNTGARPALFNSMGQRHQDDWLLAPVTSP